MKQRWILISVFASVFLILVAVVGLTYADGQESPPSRASQAPFGISASIPLSTSFTYQGKLELSGEPINDACEMAFRLYDAATAGSQVGLPLTHTVAISDGLFTQSLDFGSGIIAGDARWLEVRVKCPDDSGFTDLGRQELMASPYALYATSAGGLQGNPVTGTVPIMGQVLEWNGSMWGPGEDDDTISFWSLTGDTGTNPATHFLGTADDQALAVRTNDVERVRIDSVGNVGIGTTAPASPLDVQGDAIVGGKLQVESVHGGGRLNMSFVETEVLSSTNTPLAIPDNNPVGVTDTIAVPDIGIAQRLTVSIDISNSDISGIEVTLSDPNSNSYTLYDGSSSGTQLVTSYPDPTPPVSGDLETWIGQNPQGNWTLRVVDNDYLNNALDGQINSWSVSFLTADGNTVRISNGDVAVDGSVGIGVTDPQSALHVVGDYIQFPTITGGSPPTTDCDATEELGRMIVRVDGPPDLYVCTNSGWEGK
jgi:subtilisin-like proprotein convertase family protein